MKEALIRAQVPRPLLPAQTLSPAALPAFDLTRPRRALKPDRPLNSADMDHIRDACAEGQRLSLKPDGLQDALEFRTIGYDLICLLADEIEHLRSDLGRHGMGCGCRWHYAGSRDLEGTLKTECRYHMNARRAVSDLLAELRSEGWSVAVHNDYRQNGIDHTFWLLTHPDGRWIKGEGRTDAHALAKAKEASVAPKDRSVEEPADRAQSAGTLNSPPCPTPPETQETA